MIAEIPTQPKSLRAVRRSSARPAHDLAIYCFPSQLGWMALAADGDTVGGLTFGHELEPEAIRNLNRIVAVTPQETVRIDDAPEEIRTLVKRLQEFSQGQETDFLDAKLSLKHLTPFGEKVTRHCRRIAWGKTMSYRELAEACGRPRAARAVGNVMRNNRFPLLVPCHRVLASGGGLGGYSAPQGLRMKERLLDLERRS